MQRQPQWTRGRKTDANSTGGTYNIDYVTAGDGVRIPGGFLNQKGTFFCLNQKRYCTFCNLTGMGFEYPAGSLTKKGTFFCLEPKKVLYLL